ncbi:MAG: hypothetical protein KGI29_10495, partial [Pseudomonadota bacterium]|nr:hypothetical protein [Pseudomonadota bacterium]
VREMVKGLATYAEGISDAKWHDAKTIYSRGMEVYRDAKTDADIYKAALAELDNYQKTAGLARNRHNLNEAAKILHDEMRHKGLLDSGRPDVSTSEKRNLLISTLVVHMGESEKTIKQNTSMLPDFMRGNAGVNARNKAEEQHKICANALQEITAYERVYVSPSPGVLAQQHQGNAAWLQAMGDPAVVPARNTLPVVSVTTNGAPAATGAGYGAQKIR